MDVSVLLDIAATAEAWASVILAGLAVVGAGGLTVYAARRKSNGQSALPGSAHDETVDAIRDLKTAVEKQTEALQTEHGKTRLAIREGIRTSTDEHNRILDYVLGRRSS